MYESKAKILKISAISRASVKIRDNFYTIEASEERSLEGVDGADIDMEWKALFDEVNSIVDYQIDDIVKSTK